ncbi:MAG: putative PEP-binding protein [Propioniciclava sp.]
MIGVVVVCHSRSLAEAAVSFACAVDQTETPRVQIAAGTEDGSLGTDALAIRRAIVAADSGDGVLVLLDLGSALLSAELGTEFLPDDLADRVRITPAPLVEGLVAVLAAAPGTDLAGADEAARSALTAKERHVDGEEPARPLLIRRPPVAPTSRRSIVWRAPVTNPRGLHLRPAASIATALAEVDADVELSNASTGAGPAPARSLSKVTALQVSRGQVLQARIRGPEAAQAREVLADLSARNFGDATSDRPDSPATGLAARRTTPQAVGPSDTLPVVGSVALRTSGPATVGYVPGTAKEELARYADAVAAVDGELARLATAGGDPSGIIGAQTVLLADRELNHEVVSRITEGYSAVDAVRTELSRAARVFDELTSAYLRERAQDLRGLRRLLLLALMGHPLAAEGPDAPHVWVVDELDTPAALQLDTRTCLGVITTTGGPYGHGVLTARARGIPVLTGVAVASTLRDGDQVAFDPLTAELWIEPDDHRRRDLAHLRVMRRRAAQRALGEAHTPAQTSDGVTIPVLANLSTLADAVQAGRFGADGAGLVRTEILFGSRTEAPDAEEQAEVYRTLARTIDGPVTVRTWDAGADKPVAFLPTGRMTNPALGTRGIRAMPPLEELFAEQLRALMIAARDVPIQVLLPMVGAPAEVQWARTVLERVRAELSAPPLPLGIMVEIPAAALRLADFAELIDFASFGTNDLAQFTWAADRGDPDQAGLIPPADPAVLDLIALGCRALPDAPITVCGALASDTRVTERLLSLGVTALSVSPPRVPEIKEAVRTC